MKFLKSDRGLAIICSAVLVLGTIAIAEIVERYTGGRSGIVPLLKSINWPVVATYVVMISLGSSLGAYALVSARSHYLRFRRPMFIVTGGRRHSMPAPTARLRCINCEDTYPMSEHHSC